MKFAARDGTTARTLAVTSVPGPNRAGSPPALFTQRIGRDSAPAAAPAGPAVGPAVGPLAGRTAGHYRPTGGPPGGAASTGPGRPRQQRPATVTYQKGQEIFSPGNGGGLVYIVRSGCVRLFKTLPDGRSINLAMLGPNTIFTQEDGFDGLATGATAEALVDSTLSVVDSDDLTELIADSPDLAAAVVAGMTRRLTELQTLVEHLLVRDTSVRLATTLLSLVARFGRPTADGMVALALPLTHQSLANMIGSNRVTVTRKLLEFQEQGLVRSLGRNAMSVNPDGLRTHAQSAGGRDE